MTLDYLNRKTTPSPKPKPHLRYGACSLFIGLFFATPVLICMVVIFFSLQTDKIPELLSITIFVLAYFGCPCCPLGLFLGIAGVYLGGPHKKWAYPGIVANGAPIVFFCIGLFLR